MIVLDIRTESAHSPQRNSVFCNRKPLSLPRYKFWVRFSVDTTSAVLLGFAARIFFTSSTEIMPAEQPCHNMHVTMFTR